MDDNLKKIYTSIAVFLKKEVESQNYSAETIESLEIAKQCIENAFGISSEGEQTVYDLYELCKKTTIAKLKIEFPPVSEEAKQIAENLKTQGNQCMKEDKFEEAIACYGKAIEVAPYTAVYYCNRAAAYSRIDKHQETIKDCEKALEIDPLYSKAYGRMGLAYSSIGNHNKACECYEKALELDPTNENCQQNLQIARNRLQASGADLSNLTTGLADFLGLQGGGAAAGGTPGAGGFDLTAFMGNPMIQNLTRRMATDPGVRNLMVNMMSEMNQWEGPGQNPDNASNGEQAQPGTTAGDQPHITGNPNLDHVLRMGHHVTEQLQVTNPELVNSVRQSLIGAGLPYIPPIPTPNNAAPDSDGGPSVKKEDSPDGTS